VTQHTRFREADSKQVDSKRWFYSTSVHPYKTVINAVHEIVCRLEIDCVRRLFRISNMYFVLSTRYSNRYAFKAVFVAKIV